jgi:glycosyltransferase involved in cell wall biosynthesis
MRLLLISPYHSGSHAAWAEGYRQRSGHTVELLTLPGRFWKWRMHGGAVTLAREFLALDYQPDLILTTDMLDLTTFLALTRTGVKTAVYMHENQLTYPLPGDPASGPMRRQKGERDLHYVFVNYASMLAADRVYFNSDYHREALLAALPNFLKHFPDFQELDSLPALAAKSETLPVGVDLRRLGTAGGLQPKPEPPLILWNQRWEYDKNPGEFFRALYATAEAGAPFRLALCGENFRRRPSEFDRALEKLSDRIIHAGYANSDQYKALLAEAAVVVSTAVHEFFGISVIEAIYSGAFPLLPHRLSYPELIPPTYHRRCLYQNFGGLLERLRWALTHSQERNELSAGLAAAVARFDWSQLIPEYDQRLQDLVRNS